jgi:hypothetical protein
MLGKVIFFAGLLCFAASFFAPSTPQEMTSPTGKSVERWNPPSHTHFVLALEPILRFLDVITAEKDADAPDGKLDEAFNEWRGNAVWRAVYSIPAACGWFTIYISLLVVPLAWRQPRISTPLKRGLRGMGILLLTAVPLLARDFYRDATTSQGHFHLGAGAYLILAAYASVGASLVSDFRAKRTPAHPLPGAEQIR